MRWYEGLSASTLGYLHYLHDALEARDASQHAALGDKLENKFRMIRIDIKKTHVFSTHTYIYTSFENISRTVSTSKRISLNQSS